MARVGRDFQRSPNLSAVAVNQLKWPFSMKPVSRLVLALRSMSPLSSTQCFTPHPTFSEGEWKAGQILGG